MVHFKREHLIEHFNENPQDPSKKGLWKAVKDLKKKFVPNYIKMKNMDGRHVPLAKRAETIATYLKELEQPFRARCKYQPNCR